MAAEKNVASDVLDRANDTHRQPAPLKIKTASEQLGKVLGKNATRSRPLPEFAGDELFNRYVPDGEPSAGKLSRKAKE